MFEGTKCRKARESSSIQFYMNDAAFATKTCFSVLQQTGSERVLGRDRALSVFASPEVMKPIDFHSLCLSSAIEPPVSKLVSEHLLSIKIKLIFKGREEGCFLQSP